jgi:glycosyltransferase involved in cell wall biosynthesis
MATPKISLINPARYESISIKQTIQSALENPYQNKEIIIVDNHSTNYAYQQALSFL